MRTTQQYSITLPRNMARLIEKKIESGAYATVSEVLREGVRSLVDRDAALEKWLRTEAVASYKQYKANPDSGVPLKEAFARLKKKAKARHSTKRR